MHYRKGGREGYVCDSAEVYDQALNSWSPIKAMWSKRYGLAAVVLGGKIYALGGTDSRSTDSRGGSSTNCLNTVEAYDPSSNSWSIIKPMWFKRCRLGAVVFQGKIYALGGNDRWVEAYDPLSNSWSAIQPMWSKRQGLAAVVL